ncbi:MAG: hypothetical protein ACOCRK_07895 [bacterium]
MEREIFVYLNEEEFSEVEDFFINVIKNKSELKRFITAGYKELTQKDKQKE